MDWRQTSANKILNFPLRHGSNGSKQKRGRQAENRGEVGWWFGCSDEAVCVGTGRGCAFEPQIEFKLSIGVVHLGGFMLGWFMGK